MNDKERTKVFNKERAKIISGKTAIQRNTFAEIERLLKLAASQVAVTLAGTPTDYQAWNLPQLQNAITGALDDIGRLNTEQISSGANTIWQQGVYLIDKPVAAAGVEIAAVLPAIDTGQLIAMRSFMTERIKDVTMAVANKINSELGLVAIGAKTPGEAITQVQTLLDSTRSRALTIVRTELGRAFSVATNERMKQASEYLPGLKKQWRRSGKIHSRFHHDAADGQIVDHDKPFKLHPKTGTVSLMFPRDPAAPAAETINCGCESLPYMDSWEVTNPGKVPFTDDELQKSAMKRALNSGTRVKAA